MTEDPTTFMLTSLRLLQDNLLRLMEQTRRYQLAEGDNLEWALTDVVTAYRELRDGRLSWGAAWQVYRVASNVQIDCDMAVMDAQMANNAVWQRMKWLTSQEAS